MCECRFKVMTAEGVLWAQAPGIVGKPLKCDQIFKISYGFKSLLYKPINIAKKKKLTSSTSVQCVFDLIKND